MGTIVSRRRKDGSLGYTAQIRIHRQGKCIHSEAETFDRRQLATEWMRRREAELDQQRARGEPLGKGSTLAELLEWYGKDIKELTPWGRTKEADLKRLASYDIAKKNVLRLTTADYIGHVEARRRDGAGPATANNDLIWLRQVLRSARASLTVPIDLQLLEDASHELRQRRVIGKITAFAVSDRNAQRGVGDVLIRKRRIRIFHAEMHVFTNKMQVAISHQRAGQQPSFTKNLKPIANTNHQLPLGGGGGD